MTTPARMSHGGLIVLAHLARHLVAGGTPTVLRITRFGLVVGLAITAWSGALQVGAWLTQSSR